MERFLATNRLGEPRLVHVERKVSPYAKALPDGYLVLVQRSPRWWRTPAEPRRRRRPAGGRSSRLMNGEPETDTASRPRLWERLRRGLSRTHARLVEQLGGSLEPGEPFDEEARARLEEALLGADLGLATTELLLGRLETRVAAARGGYSLRELLVEEIAGLLAQIPAPPEESAAPRVTLVVGVNGVGKTTSIAKLAARELAAGRRVLLAAGDTFRAAAIEQLTLWGERLGVGDPAGRGRRPGGGLSTTRSRQRAPGAWSG